MHQPNLLQAQNYNSSHISADGSVKLLIELINDPRVIADFTGADCDPIFDVALSYGLLMSACRDKMVYQKSFIQR